MRSAHARHDLHRAAQADSVVRQGCRAMAARCHHGHVPAPLAICQALPLAARSIHSACERVAEPRRHSALPHEHVPAPLATCQALYRAAHTVRVARTTCQSAPHARRAHGNRLPLRQLISKDAPAPHARSLTPLSNPASVRAAPAPARHGAWSCCPRPARAACAAPPRRRPSIPICVCPPRAARPSARAMRSGS